MSIYANVSWDTNQGEGGIYEHLAISKRSIGDGGEAGLSGGDHFIVITSLKFNKKKKEVTVTAFDMKLGEVTFKASVSDFKDLIYQILLVEK